MRITHAAHPLRGRSFKVVPLCGGKPDPTQILIELPNGERRFVPEAWTDLVGQVDYPSGACFVPERLVILRQRLDYLLARGDEQVILLAKPVKCKEPRDHHANHTTDSLGAVDSRTTDPDHRHLNPDGAASADTVSGGGA